jgi:hypothetical protein
MAIVMNMSSYEIERDPPEAGYDNRTLYYGQNPAAQLSLQPLIATKHQQHRMPADLATVNVELFLCRM